jgi:hypothetical protein
VSYPQTTNTKVKAKVEYEEIDGIIKITGTENLTGIVQSMSYTLSVIKKTSLIIIRLIMHKKVFSLNANENKKFTTQINLGKKKTK